MYARVPQAMAQFVLKIEKLSHIMGPTPILEMARAYGLRPRLWLLLLYDVSVRKRCPQVSGQTAEILTYSTKNQQQQQRSLYYQDRTENSLLQD